MSETHDLPPPDLESTAYRGYLLIPVYRCTTAAQRAAAIGFWFEHKATNEPCLAERRSHELVYLAVAADGRIGGLTSVSLARRDTDGRTVYNFHIFIAPRDRVPYLMRELTNRTRDLLRRDSRSTPASGMRLVADNPKLHRPGIRRYLVRQGYCPRGQNRHGIDQWFAPFDPLPTPSDQDQGPHP